MIWLLCSSKSCTKSELTQSGKHRLARHGVCCLLATCTKSTFCSLLDKYILLNSTSWHRMLFNNSYQKLNSCHALHISGTYHVGSQSVSVILYYHCYHVFSITAWVNQRREIVTDHITDLTKKSHYYYMFTRLMQPHGKNDVQSWFSASPFGNNSGNQWNYIG